MFSGWLKEVQGIEEPVGLEAVRQRVLGEEPEQPSLRGGESGGLPPTPPTSEEQPQETVGDKIVGRLRSMLDGPKSVQRNGNMYADAKKLQERLAMPGRVGVFKDVINKYHETHTQSNIDDWNASNSFETPDEVIQFLQDKVGMRMINGKLQPKDYSIAEKIAFGMNPFPQGLNGREYRGANFHDILALRNGAPEHAKRIMSGSAQDEMNYNDRRKFHQKYLKNGFSYDMAEQVYNMLGVQSQLNGLGAPPGTKPTLKPKTTDIEQLSSNGEFTGDTSFDQLRFSDDPEERQIYEDSFKQGNGSSKERGIMMLQKIINSGFVDELTGVPFFGGFDHLTADHIENRDFPDERRLVELESPQNMAIIARNLNQMKSGEMPGGDKLDKDTFNKLFQSDRFKGKLGFEQFFDEDSSDFFDLDGDGNPLNDFADSNMFAAWAAYRFMNSAHFEDRLDQALEGPNANVSLDDEDDDEVTIRDDFMNNIEDLVGFDFDLKKPNLDLRKFLGPQAGMLDSVNLTKFKPQKANSGADEVAENSWRGQSGNGYDSTGFLDGFRKAMIVKLMKDPELATSTSLETLMADVKRTNKDTNKTYGKKLLAEKQKRRKAWANKNLKIPMQGIAAQYGLGRLSNSELAEKFREMGTDYLSSIADEDSDHYSSHQTILEQLNQGMDHWPSVLQTVVDGDRPLEFLQNSPAFMKVAYSEGGRQLMKSQAGRDSMSKEEIDRFYEMYDEEVNVRMKEKEKNPRTTLPEPFRSADGERLPAFGENWLTSDTDLL